MMTEAIYRLNTFPVIPEESAKPGTIREQALLRNDGIVAVAVAPDGIRAVIAQFSTKPLVSVIAVILRDIAETPTIFVSRVQRERAATGHETGLGTFAAMMGCLGIMRLCVDGGLGIHQLAFQGEGYWSTLIKLLDLNKTFVLPIERGASIELPGKHF